MSGAIEVIDSHCGDWPNCPTCSAVIRSILRDREPATYWAKPCGCELTADQYKTLSTLIRGTWRFDVPEVPAHVTAIKDSDGDVWLRSGDRWCLAGDAFDYTGSDIRDVLPHGPLVECEDPRAAS